MHVWGHPILNIWKHKKAVQTTEQAPGRYLLIWWMNRNISDFTLAEEQRKDRPDPYLTYLFRCKRVMHLVPRLKAPITNATNTTSTSKGCHSQKTNVVRFFPLIRDCKNRQMHRDTSRLEVPGAEGKGGGELLLNRHRVLLKVMKMSVNDKSFCLFKTFQIFKWNKWKLLLKIMK